MSWWIVLAVAVIGLVLIGVRGRARSGSATHTDLDALRRTRGGAEKWGGSGGV